MILRTVEKYHYPLKSSTGCRSMWRKIVPGGLTTPHFPRLFISISGYFPTFSEFAGSGQASYCTFLQSQCCSLFSMPPILSNVSLRYSPHHPTSAQQKWSSGSTALPWLRLASWSQYSRWSCHTSSSSLTLQEETRRARTTGNYSPLERYLR